MGHAEELCGRQLGQPSQFYTGVCEEKSVGKEPPLREDLSAEVEESPC
jgi:hypothetical protein